MGIGFIHPSGAQRTPLSVPSDLQALYRTVESLVVESQRFSEHFAAELTERLFREKNEVRWLMVELDFPSTFLE